MRKRLTSLLVLSIAMLTVTPASRADLNLNRLECVSLQVVLATHDEFLIITQEELFRELATRVRARLPRLRIDTACSNGLYFRVVVATTAVEGGRSLGYFGGIRLEVLRTAIILDTMTRIELTAWHDGWVLNGPPGDEKAAILSSLNGLLDKFAGAYRQAGNP